MNSYYLKISKSSDDIVLQQFYKWKDTVKDFPNVDSFRRDYNFILTELLSRGYKEKELEK